MQLVLGRTYTRNELSDFLGGSPQTYLPYKGHRVLYAALTRHKDPEAPTVILAGNKQQIAKSAGLLAQQAEPIPVFIKQQPNAWEYVGTYRVRCSSQNPDVLDEYRRRSGRSDQLSRVVFLELQDIQYQHPGRKGVSRV